MSEQNVKFGKNIEGWNSKKLLHILPWTFLTHELQFYTSARTPTDSAHVLRYQQTFLQPFVWLFSSVLNMLLAAVCFLTEWMEPTHQRLMDGSARGTSRSGWSVSQGTSLSYRCTTNTLQTHCKYNKKHNKKRKYTTSTMQIATRNANILSYMIDGSAGWTSWSRWSVSQRLYLASHLHFLDRIVHHTTNLSNISVWSSDGSPRTANKNQFVGILILALQVTWYIGQESSVFMSVFVIVSIEL